jgi:hypothetical protein
MFCLHLGCRLPGASDAVRSAALSRVSYRIGLHVRYCLVLAQLLYGLRILI